MRLFLIAVLFAPLVYGAERWRSPDDLFSIVPPEGWSYSEFKPPAGSSSYAFNSSDGKSEIRISAVSGLSLPEKLPDSLLDSAFPDERGLAPMQRTSTSTWDGLRREYVSSDQSERWIGMVARKGSMVVLLTMRAPANGFEHHRTLFDAVGKSLELRK